MEVLHCESISAQACLPMASRSNSWRARQTGKPHVDFDVAKHGSTQHKSNLAVMAPLSSEILATVSSTLTKEYDDEPRVS
jgi:hypothetical protein